MREFIITTDSTCDLPNDYIQKHNIRVLSLFYNFDDIVYGEDHQLDPHEFYELMRSGKMPTTMAANPDSARKLFEELIGKGFDILHIAFSSALSGSCSVATTVARDVCEDHPDAKIVVIDSLCASLGEGLLIHKAVCMKEDGKSIDEISTWLEKNKLNLCHLFTVDDLYHLHRGGRVSKATAVIGTLINVKPVLHVNNEGKLISLHNVRGRKKALVALVDDMEARTKNYDYKNDIFFISHGDCIEDANFVADLIKERFGIESHIINYVSPTIGAHSGPGTVALFFMGDHR